MYTVQKNSFLSAHISCAVRKMVLNSCHNHEKGPKLQRRTPARISSDGGGKIPLGHKIRFSKIVYLFKSIAQWAINFEGNSALSFVQTSLCFLWVRAWPYFSICISILFCCFPASANECFELKTFNVNKWELWQVRSSGSRRLWKFSF